MSLSEKKNFMLVLAIAVAIAIFLIFFIRRGYRLPRVTTTDRQTTLLETQSSSDEVDAIEKDLMETDLTELDRELQDIEQELNQVTY